MIVTYETPVVKVSAFMVKDEMHYIGHLFDVNGRILKVGWATIGDTFRYTDLSDNKSPLIIIPLY